MFCIFFFLPFPLFFFYPCHMAVSSWLNTHTSWYGECTSCFHFTFDWHLACPTAEYIHTLGMIVKSFHCSCCFPRLYIHVPVYSKLSLWSWISHFVYDLIWNNLFIWKWNIFVTLCSLHLLVLSSSYNKC